MKNRVFVGLRYIAIHGNIVENEEKMMGILQYGKWRLVMFDFKFNWEKNLNTSIESIDVQHKQLFKLGRDMEQLLQISSGLLQDGPRFQRYLVTGPAGIPGAGAKRPVRSLIDSLRLFIACGCIVKIYHTPLAFLCLFQYVISTAFLIPDDNIRFL